MSTFLDKDGLTTLWNKIKEAFQEKLVSGSNIKTINGDSVLGSGDITIDGGGNVVTSVVVTPATTTSGVRLTVSLLQSEVASTVAGYGTIPLATSSAVGLMSSEQYTKLTNITACNPAGGQYTGYISNNSSGVMELGKYLDLHNVDSTNDYDVRLICPADTSGVQVTLPSTSGTVALTSDINVTSDVPISLYAAAKSDVYTGEEEGFAEWAFNTTSRASSTGYLSIIKPSVSNTLGFGDPYGTIIAAGYNDTHGFFGVAYNAAGFRVGGGNNDLLNWNRKVVLYEENDEDVTIDGIVTASSFYVSSDKNLKENIQGIEPDVKKKAEYIDIKSYNFKGDDGVKYGVIAQEVEQLGLNELIQVDAEGIKSVDYISMLCLKIKALEDRVKELENKLSYGNDERAGD